MFQYIFKSKTSLFIPVTACSSWTTRFWGREYGTFFSLSPLPNFQAPVGPEPRKAGKRMGQEGSYLNDMIIRQFCTIWVRQMLKMNLFLVRMWASQTFPCRVPPVAVLGVGHAYIPLVALSSLMFWSFHSTGTLGPFLPRKFSGERIQNVSIHVSPWGMGLGVTWGSSSLQKNCFHKFSPISILATLLELPYRF